jgi:hypothetical protein
LSRRSSLVLSHLVVVVNSAGSRPCVFVCLFAETDATPIIVCVLRCVLVCCLVVASSA